MEGNQPDTGSFFRRSRGGTGIGSRRILDRQCTCRRSCKARDADSSPCPCYTSVLQILQKPSLPVHILASIIPS